MDVLTRSAELFRAGQTCKSLAMLNSLTFDTFNVQEWMKENNVLVCQATQALMETVTANTVNKCLSDFQELLSKIHSSPADPEFIAMEMYVLYNILTLHVLTNYNSHDTPCSTLTHSVCDSLVNTTWKRVYGLSLATSPEQCLLNDGQAALELLQKLLTLQQRIPALKPDVLSLALVTCCLWCMCLHQRSDRSLAIRGLKMINTFIQRNQQESFLFDPGKTLKHIVTLPFCARSCNYIDTHADVIDLHTVIPLVLIATCHSIDHGTVNEQDTRERVSQLSTSDLLWKPLIVYMEGIVLYKSEKYSLALDKLQSLTNTEMSNQDTELQARVYHLAGCCHAQQNENQQAIRMCKQALELNFNFLRPLYSVARQYQKLQRADAELEALMLLISARENASAAGTQSSSSVRTLYCAISRLIILCDPTGQDITLTQAHYALANRLSQLHRLSTAGDKYMNLITMVTETAFLQEFSSSTEIELPSLSCLYHETCECLLMSERYDECLTLCDRYLACFTFQTDDPLTDLRITDPNAERYEPDKGHITSLEDHVWFRVCRARCLLNESRYVEAELVLKSVITDLESHIRCGRVSKLSSPVSKRRKINTDSADDEDWCTTDDKGTAQSWAECSLCDVYLELAGVMMKQGHTSSAQHYYRLAMQTNQNNTNVMFRYTSFLLDMDDMTTAGQIWLDFREMDHKMDSFHLSNLFNNVNLQLRDACDDDKSKVAGQHARGIQSMHGGRSVQTSTDLLKMDNIILQYLISVREQEEQVTGR